MAMLYPSYPFGHYCVPDVAAIANQTVAAMATTTADSFFQDAQEQTARVVTDLVTAHEVIIGAAFGTFVVSLLVMFLIQKLAGVLVWAMVLVMLVAGAALGYEMLVYSKQEGASEDDLSTYLEYGSYVTWGATALMLLVVLFLRTQIKIGIEVTKQAAHAMRDMPTLYVLPFIARCVHTRTHAHTHTAHTVHTHSTHSTHSAHTQHTHTAHTAHTQHTHSTHSTHTAHTQHTWYRSRTCPSTIAVTCRGRGETADTHAAAPSIFPIQDKTERPDKGTSRLRPCSIQAHPSTSCELDSQTV
jgi:hypothetical protein